MLVVGMRRVELVAVAPLVRVVVAVAGMPSAGCMQPELPGRLRYC